MPPTTTSKNLGQIAAVISSPTAPSNQNVIWLDTSGLSTVKKVWDPIAAAWVPLTDVATVAGDNWGTQVAITDDTLSGDGTSGNPLSIAQQGATTGQVLKWNGTSYAPDNEDPGGLTAVATDDTLVGDGSTGAPLSIAPQGAAELSVMTFVGGSWVPRAPDTSGALQSGMILMWSGAISAIPSGWFLCDGSNGTPNLSGMFVVGYNVTDADYNQIGKTGGTKTVQLTGIQNGLHTHGVNDTGHTHGFSLGTDNKGGSSGIPVLSSQNTTGQKNYTTAASFSGVSIQNSGAGAPHENRPPFYTLAYIMKA